MNTTKNLALRKPLLISACLLAMQGAAYAQNPIVQTQLTTDPAPLVVGDRLYVYTGHDEDKADFFWMNEWRVYSTKDMVNWTDHGSPLDLSSFSWATTAHNAGNECPNIGLIFGQYSFDSLRYLACPRRPRRVCHGLMTHPLFIFTQLLDDFLKLLNIQ